MSYEVSLHEIEAARMARIHAGTGEREPVRVWEIKPVVRTAEEQSADNQTLLGASAGIVQRALARGLVKIVKENPAEVKPAKKKRKTLLERRAEHVLAAGVNAERVRACRAKKLEQGLTTRGTVRVREDFSKTQIEQEVA